MAELTDPRERAGCACPRLGARECVRSRSRPRIDDAFDFDEDDYECECACHGLYEESLRCEFCEDYPCTCGGEDCRVCGCDRVACACPSNEGVHDV